jgi:hypothetical protein
MRQRYVSINGEWVPANEAAERASGPFVMPDITPFKSPDGAYITGRRAWREHLKVTNSIEMSHSDVKAAQAQWAKRKEAHKDRLKGSEQCIADAEKYAPKGEVRPYQMSRLNVEMANRLHGRPTPERKEMIKLTLDTAKRMSRR